MENSLPIVRMLKRYPARDGSATRADGASQVDAPMSDTLYSNIAAPATGQAKQPMHRIDYSPFDAQLAGINSRTFDAYVGRRLPQQLSDLWCRSYKAAYPDAEMVLVQLYSFSYLFDVTGGRNIAAYGIMGGKNLLPRDHARMAGYPKAEDRSYHRGHMIPHSGHGGTDINLFIQKGSVNVGPFRELEILAVDHPGSFYFVRLLYRIGPSQRPMAMEQGLFMNENPPKMEIRYFMN
jgi:hypothetical protein